MEIKNKLTVTRQGGGDNRGKSRNKYKAPVDKDNVVGED